MDIPSALAAELARLTKYLDDPTADVEHGLRLLAGDARLAVPSYLGLSVLVCPSLGPPLSLTALESGAVAADVRTSLAIPLTAPPPQGGTALMILYAATPGAFVDLAADVAWLTGSPLDLFVLDGHLDGQLHGVLRHRDGAAWRVASLIDQAVGVLIGRGRTPEEAERHLDEHARLTGIDRRAAAEHVLGTLPAADGGDGDG